MTDLRTAAQQALELRRLADKFSEGWHDGIKIDATDVMLLVEVAAALEQPKPPPEAQTEAEKIAYCAGWWAAMEQKLEQPEQQEQEPVAWINPKHLQGLTLGLYGYAEIYTDESQGRIPLYTHPPRREWRGLTEEELRRLWRESSFRGNGGQIDWFTEGARVAEAALKERNA
jgi:hypothetical protein